MDLRRVLPAPRHRFGSTLILCLASALAGCARSAPSIELVERDFKTPSATLDPRQPAILVATLDQAFGTLRAIGAVGSFDTTGHLSDALGLLDPAFVDEGTVEGCEAEKRLGRRARRATSNCWNGTGPCEPTLPRGLDIECPGDDGDTYRAAITYIRRDDDLVRIDVDFRDWCVKGQCLDGAIRLRHTPRTVSLDVTEVFLISAHLTNANWARPDGSRADPSPRWAMRLLSGISMESVEFLGFVPAGLNRKSLVATGSFEIRDSEFSYDCSLDALGGWVCLGPDGRVVGPEYPDEL